MKGSIPAFRRALLDHFDGTRRALPWRSERTPYRVMVSEFMLQQTRVEAVIPYYERWLRRFPGWEALADAGEDEVLRAWTGLGYYRRARNLHRAARIVRERYGGELPEDSEALKRLPGVGEYTAGAVASIAFGKAVPAVDGNVKRVLCRLFDLEAPTAGRLREEAAALVDPGRPAAGLAVAAAVSALGETALYWHPEATVGWAEAGAVLQEQAKGTSEVWVVGASADSDRWWLEVNLLGPELPGGGSTMFPDRRLVAFYGVTHTGVLGVLGEQGPSEGLERMAPYLEEYAADGLPTIPTFEIIATVATARAGRDGDYSGEISVEDLTPWVEFAAGEGVYVVLDLQPGRTDFLTQAKYYEELLALPHVGLALDPEWRLRSDQVHLRQIGSVDAAEVNAVAEWLAELVRRERLPQKLLMVHQFRFTMIRDRETISVPPELAVVIHMDGQGPLATKYSTWGALTAGAEEQGWHWGWKNFFDEDYPLATPEQVLELDPLVVFVSYQ